MTNFPRENIVSLDESSSTGNSNSTLCKANMPEFAEDLLPGTPNEGTVEVRPHRNLPLDARPRPSSRETDSRETNHGILPGTPGAPAAPALRGLHLPSF
jgi:hypothetical protein